METAKMSADTFFFSGGPVPAYDLTPRNEAGRRREQTRAKLADADAKTRLGERRNRLAGSATHGADEAAKGRQGATVRTSFLASSWAARKALRTGAPPRKTRHSY